VQPWHELRVMLDPHLVGRSEPPPEIPLKEFLAQRRALALMVSKAAKRVIDAIDQNPA
jgi:hypothetical protein